MQPADGLAIDEVAECIGHLSFVSAYDRQPDSLWVDLKVPETIFADLWQWARTDSHLAVVYFDVYGEAIEHVDHGPNNVYHWAAKQSDCWAPIHVTNFGYAFHRAFGSDPSAR